MTASVEKATLKVVNQRIMVMVGPAEITFRTNEVGGGIVIDGHKTKFADRVMAEPKDL